MLCFVVAAAVLALVGGINGIDPSALDIINSIPPATADGLEIGAYMGRWFLMYTSVIPLATYLQGGQCITADYYEPQNENGMPTFKILNSLR